MKEEFVQKGCGSNQEKDLLSSKRPDLTYFKGTFQIAQTETRLICAQSRDLQVRDDTL